MYHDSEPYDMCFLLFISTISKILPFTVILHVPELSCVDIYVVWNWTLFSVAILFGVFLRVCVCVYY